MQSDDESKGHEKLVKLTEADQNQFESCLENVEHTFPIDEGTKVSLNLHSLKFTGDGRPKVEELAVTLVDHLVYYAISSSRRPDKLKPHEHSKLAREAREYLRLTKRAGEAGEILLYFLLETVLKAPQLLCKIALKTNRRDEVKGSDGIHGAWNAEKGCLRLYAGESKIYSRFSEAISNAIESLLEISKPEKWGQEIKLVTSHFKHADEHVKAKILKVIDTQNSTEPYEIVYAVLIGYDWQMYQKLEDPKEREKFIAEFKERYLADAEGKFNDLKDKLTSENAAKLAFHFFFLPFPNVQEFRDAFIKAVTGV